MCGDCEFCLQFEGYGLTVYPAVKTLQNQVSRSLRERVFFEYAARSPSLCLFPGRSPPPIHPLHLNFEHRYLLRLTQLRLDLLIHAFHLIVESLLSGVYTKGEACDPPLPPLHQAAIGFENSRRAAGGSLVSFL